jgi:hypothetical protein
VFGAAGVAALGADARFPDLPAAHDQAFCLGHGAAKGCDRTEAEIKLVSGAAGQVTDIICVAVMKEKSVEHGSGFSGCGIVIDVPSF